MPFADNYTLYSASPNIVLYAIKSDVIKPSLDTSCFTSRLTDQQLVASTTVHSVSTV